ncbi:cell division/cell wall cluster transcriptional repressor MraZ [Candidatus Daviesbacteria bacterium]|nr:cell division/cell wall cluster transcriptional repressor MraZ [Candidatus Daviesbacteria bacterium]
MFLGTYNLTFSGKGRIILPKKFRKELKKPEIILMKGIDGGIWGFSIESWQEFVKKQLEIPITLEQGRTLRREFFPFSESSELDKQGRFVISDFLLRLVNIKEKIVLIGAGDHFEIWNPTKLKGILTKKLS